MAKEVKRRGGTTANHSAFIGAVREITIDTDKDVPVVHDGTQVGGFPALRADLANIQTAIGGFRNAVINGAFNVNQYPAAALTVNTTSQYVCDRWRVTSSTAGLVCSIANDSMTFTAATINTVVTLRHRIEAVNSRVGVGQRRVLSFTAQAAQPDALQFQVHSANVADNFTAVTSRAVNTVAIGTVPQRLSLVVPTNAAFANGTEISFALTLGAIGEAFLISNVQLETVSAVGPAPPTPFERRPYAAELALSERYYEIGGVGNSLPGVLYSGAATSGQSYRGGCTFRTTKRAVPTVALTHISGSNVGFGAISGTPTNVTVNGFNETRTSNATVTGGFFASSFTASAEL